MSIENLQTAPTVGDFTPLVEHEAQTPSTFFGAKPVLHAHNTAGTILGPKRLLADDTHLPFRLLKDSAQDFQEATTDASIPFEDAFCSRGCEVFVTTDSVILSFPTVSNPLAISIPYPAISLHAIQRLYVDASMTTYSTTSTSACPTALQSIYLQIDPAYSTRAQTNPDLDDDEGGEAVELLIIPSTPHGVDGAENGDEGSHNGEPTPESQAALVKTMFEAMSRCADLHPDPAEEGDEMDVMDGSGGLGGLGGMPGAGGWITAENMHEFEGQFEDADEEDEEDGEEGNGVGGVRILGLGAGMRRAREDGDVNGDDDVNWPRTKWYRMH